MTCNPLCPHYFHLSRNTLFASNISSLASCSNKYLTVLHWIVIMYSDCFLPHSNIFHPHVYVCVCAHWEASYMLSILSLYVEERERESESLNNALLSHESVRVNSQLTWIHCVSTWVDLYINTASHASQFDSVVVTFTLQTSIDQWTLVSNRKYFSSLLSLLHQLTSLKC